MLDKHKVAPVKLTPEKLVVFYRCSVCERIYIDKGGYYLYGLFGKPRVCANCTEKEKEH